MSKQSFFVILIVLVSMVSYAKAAEVSIEDSKIVTWDYGDRCLIAHIRLSGDIVDGDADQLQSTIARVDESAREQRSSCYVNDGVADRLIYVSLESDGGLYIEGWKIAKLLSKAIVATYVAEGNHCYSACAIAFLGGSVPGAEGATLIRRILHPSARLGFHAPFPVLDDKPYDAKTVEAFFLTAFTISSDFMKSAKSMGITYEVAQLLLQPTPNSLFEIDTTGRAILTNISVSSKPFSFSVYQTNSEPSILTEKSLVNVCFNNQILRNSGDTGPSYDFLKYRIETQQSLFTRVKTKTKYFSFKEVVSTVLVVPVTDIGEGEVQSCVVQVADVPRSNGTASDLKFACMGFSNGEAALANSIKTKSVDQVPFGDQERCLSSSRLALLPFNTKLSDIPIEYQGD